MKKLLLVLVLAAVVAGGVFGYRYWRQNGNAENGNMLTLYGNVDIRKVDLGFRVGGRIAAVFFEEGDAWTVTGAGERPPDFPCDWAWNDLEKTVLAMTLGGEFGRWMRDPHTFVACCTDGVKPVVFKLERL